MLTKTSKILLGIYAFLLLVILLTFSDNIGLILLLITGVFAFIVSIFIANDVKKSKNHIISKILNTILVNLTLYSAIMLFYSLSNIGLGEMGLLYALVLALYTILCFVSIITDIVIIILNKKVIYGGKIKKFNLLIFIILILIFITFFYTPTITKVAVFFQDISICSLHLETNDVSFIFMESAKDTCKYEVIITTQNPNYCEQVKDENRCLIDIASLRNDTNICYRIVDSDSRSRCILQIAEKTSNLSMCEINEVLDKNMCYSGIARNNGNAAICDYIKDYEPRYYCYSIIAIGNRNTSICEKYFPSNEILIQEGVNTERYSRDECIIDATKGSFN